MKRVVLILILAMCGNARAGEEIGYIETFALAEDRAEALKQLVPGTDEYYYYTCLHYQNTGQDDLYLKCLNNWTRRHNGTIIGQARELMNRQALLDYDKNPVGTLDYIRKELNLRFDHRRSTGEKESTAPTRLDNSLISVENLMKKALHYNSNLNRIEDRGLELVVGRRITPDQRRNLLGRLQRPDFPGIVDTVFDDLHYKHSRGFGHHPIHEKLLLAQLDELLSRDPRLRNETRFVNAYLAKLAPMDEVDLDLDPGARVAYLDRVWAFVRTLDPVHNSLKANVLYRRLTHDREQSVYDKHRFMEYLKLPRNVPYLHEEVRRKITRSEHLAQLDRNFGLFGLPPVGDEEPLVRDFLMRFMEAEEDYEAYRPWVRDDFLKRLFAASKIVNGIGDPEKWASLLSAAEYKALKERVDIDFAPDNPKELDADEPVRLGVYVKNVPVLIVKVFEINTFNYFRETGRPLNLAINLDGLVASQEKRLNYSELPERRVLRTLDFPQLSRRGVYVIELIGNGRSSRALLQKGRLGLLQKVTAGGHVFTVLDEENRRVPEAKIWMQGREFTPADDGTIAIPFSADPRTETLILQQGDFAVLKSFRHEAEQYDLKSGIYVDRESLVRREKAQVLVRPVLRVNNQPTSLSLLEEVRLVIRSVDHRGIASEKEIADFPLHEDRDSPYEFKVPEDLSTLEISLRARVQNISRNKKEDLRDDASFTLNQIDQGPAVQDLHVSRTAKGYIVELRGKNGEPRPGQGLSVFLKHRMFRDEVKVSLRTDEEGRCYLGALGGIERFRISGPRGADHTWHPRDHAYLFPRELHGRAGETLRLPILYANGEDLSQVSLLEERHGRFVRNWKDALAVRDGFLELRDLQAGNYSLFLKTEAQTLSVRVTGGEEKDGFVLSGKRALERPRLAPLHLGEVEVNDESISLRLVNATPFTRVHLFASRYLPAHDLFAALGFSWDPGLLKQNWTRPRIFYESGRKIGDEYRYILDRQLAKKFPGNMLERPGLLLNPWAVRDTGTGQEQLEQGAAYRGAAAGKDQTAALEAAIGPGRGMSADGYGNLDFLAAPSVALVNLKPDADGRIRIPREKVQGRTQLRILAVDPMSSLLREVVLVDSPVRTRELRLVKGLDPEKLYAEQKLVSLVGEGEAFTIEDAVTSSFETYDTLAQAYRLLSTLNRNETLQEFDFILRWPKMDREERRRLYSKYACHELNFFLFHKDPPFFEEVIRPNLDSKKDQTFMDSWLLGHSLDEYLQPWRYARLNTVERILLGRVILEQRTSIGREARERNDLLPPDIEGFNRRFDTAVKSRALEAGGQRLGMLQKASRKAEAEAVAAMSTRERAPADLALSMPVAAKPSPAPPSPPSVRASRVQAKKMKAGEKGEGLAEEQLHEAGKAASDDADFFANEDSRRAGQRRFFQKLDKTREWAENNYYHLPIKDQLADLVPVNDFWAEYAAHDDRLPFTSRYFAQTTRNFTEMMLALAVIDLPFEAGGHNESVEGVAFTLKAASPLVVFHREIREAELEDEGSPVLVSQNFFRADDRYRSEGNERAEKYVTEEFLPHVVYGCQVILTNPSASRQKLHLLLQLPLGAMPVNNGFATRGLYQVVEPYGTTSVEYSFYFPATGSYPHYPVTVARNSRVIVSETPFLFNVVEQPSRADTTSWAWISQNGTPEEVITYLETHNIHRTDLGQVAWRMKDKDYFSRITSLVEARHAYHQILWSYGIYHNDRARAGEFLRHSPFADRCGAHLRSPLLVLDPVERLTYEHLEYAPLVNPRAHQVGRERKILNHRLREQVQRLMKVLSYKAALSDEDELAVTYYLALQERVEESLRWLDRVERNRVREELQYDYLHAYLSLYRDDMERAGELAARYRDYPVDKWRNRFVNVQAQLDELTEGAGEAVDPEDRDQAQARLAATEPSLDFRVEGRKILIDYRNLEECTLNFYPMDIELLFSRNPFLQKDAAQFSFIRPRLSRILKLPGGGEEIEIDIPGDFRTRNVMIEVVAAGLKKSQAYYANTLRVDLIENYGQLRVTHGESRVPLSKIYVKVYARTKDGRVTFFKDGYTDFRGRFDYVSLNTNELDNVERLATLVLSEEYGALVREASPPKR